MWVNVYQKGDDTVIAYLDLERKGGGWATITLSGVTADSIGADNFILPAGDYNRYDISLPDGIVMHRGDGKNVLYGSDGDDHIYGGAGDDHLYGYSRHYLYNQEGDDRLYGGKGDDHLYGGAGDDILNGGKGDAELSGGDGDDTLTGGKGSDKFMFWLGGSGDDTVTDYEAGEKIFIGHVQIFDNLIIKQDGDDTVIRHENYYGLFSGSIRLAGVSADSLRAC